MKISREAVLQALSDLSLPFLEIEFDGPQPDEVHIKQNSKNLRIQSLNFNVDAGGIAEVTVDVYAEDGQIETFIARIEKAYIKTGGLELFFEKEKRPPGGESGRPC